MLADMNGARGTERTDRKVTMVKVALLGYALKDIASTPQAAGHDRDPPFPLPKSKTHLPKYKPTGDSFVQRTSHEIHPRIAVSNSLSGPHTRRPGCGPGIWI